MVYLYDLSSIPPTSSDSSNIKSNHYKIKQRLIEWLKDNEVILDKLRMVSYEGITINNGGSAYRPDVIFFTEKGEVWFEIETNPFNVFVKFVELLYLQGYKHPHWPKIIIFAVPEANILTRRYFKSFDVLKKILRIKECRLYIVNTGVRRMR